MTDPTSAEAWKKRAEDLWQIIDDIDTYSDVAKGNHELYRNLVYKRQKDRFAILTSNGYDLFLPGTEPPPSPEDRQEVMKFNGG
jgi:hypothetical protein